MKTLLGGCGADSGRGGEAADGQEVELPGQERLEFHHLPESHRQARIGDVVLLDVHNTTGMTHPWHLHGFTAQPRSLTFEDGARFDFPPGEWEDTVAIPGGATLRVIVPVRDPAGDGSAAGRWMEHCHLLQHGERGMMSEWVVTE